MLTVVDQLRKESCQGYYKKLLLNYCIQTQSDPSDYVLKYAVRTFVKSSKDQHLYQILTNERFRELKKKFFGKMALRRDLQLGLNYFSVNQPDLLRYLKILFLEQQEGDNSNQLAIHENYCKDFSDFLQLNVPSSLRTNNGIHKVLNRLFPMEIRRDLYKDIENEQKNSDDALIETAKFDLIDYEVGTWSCRCGKIKKHKNRFNYSCECGAISGNGILEKKEIFCFQCNKIPKYILCQSCKTRVSLDLMWKIENGNVHPVEFNLPLDAHLLITIGDTIQEETLTLTMIPLLLGLYEEEGIVSFRLPDLFWINLSPTEEKKLFILKDSMKYDRQTEFRKILEVMLRRTFQFRKALESHLEKNFCNWPQKRKIIPNIIKGFSQRLVSQYNPIIDKYSKFTEIFRFVDTSFECSIATSSILKDKMIIVNSKLTLPSAFRTSFINNVSTTIRASKFGNDILTPSPMGIDKPLHLNTDGIVKIGAIVTKGQILIGIERPRFEPDLPPEEKLLRAIFGEKVGPTEDVSLVYEGEVPAKIIGITINVSKKWQNFKFKKEKGKLITVGGKSFLSNKDLIHISISFVVEKAIEVGDRLYSEDAHEGVICKIMNRKELIKSFGLTFEPDLIMSPNHSWNSLIRRSKSHFPFLRLGFKSESLLLYNFSKRGIGPYSLITQEPICENYYSHIITGKEIDWLISQGTQDIVFELLNCHCDNSFYRNKLFENLATGKSISLKNFKSIQRDTKRSLTNYRGGIIQNFSYFIKGLGIDIILNEEQGEIHFSLMIEDDILHDSFGEVKTPETINYRTLQPDKNGLFCEKIFGPVRDYSCRCGKYKRMKHKGKTCEKCGVDICLSKVRRERIGHITLPIPVIHPLYKDLICGFIADNFQISIADIKKIFYYEKTAIIDPNDLQKPIVSICQSNQIEKTKKLRNGQILVEGALFAKIIIKIWNQRANKKSINEHWERTITEKLVVIPPDHRPMVPLKNGTFATSDLNDLYRRVINRKNRLARLIELNAPRIIILNESRCLQEAVDILFDNHTEKRLMGSNYRPLRSLIDLKILSDDESTVVDCLLKRPLDYSAQTRIVVENTRDMDIAFLPNALAWEMLLPVIYRNFSKEDIKTFKAMKREISVRSDSAFQALNKACSDAIILLKPTFSRWGLIALRPKLTSNLALSIHPKLMENLGWKI